MRRIVFIGLAAVVVMLAAGSVSLWQRNAALTQDVDHARASNQAAQSQYGEAVAAIAEIQDSLGTLGVSDATRPLLPGSQAAERGLSAEQQRTVLDRIALLKAGISRTREHIASLESRLHHSGIRIAGLQRMIDNLKRAADERDAQVAALAAQVDSLHTEVTGLTAVVSTTRDSIQNQAQVMDVQRRELGTVYYVIGSRGALQRAGVLHASGGVLGLGKTLLPTADASTAMFKPLDTDNENALTIHAPRARVVSGQPAGSYTLVPEGGQVVLRITDPREFRTVKRLVIVSMS